MNATDDHSWRVREGLKGCSISSVHGGEISTATPVILFEDNLKIKVLGEKNWKWDWARVK